jgi:hypothetical protein
MRSHQYQIKIAEAVRAVLPTLAGVGLIIIGLKAAAWLSLLPAKAAEQDLNGAFLAHQARAASATNHAQIVLLGDSTCMFGVDAPTLSRELLHQPSVINLALPIWFRLDDYGRMLSDFAAANPLRDRMVVLLVTPEKLTRHMYPSWEEIWNSIRYHSRNPGNAARDGGWLTGRLGLEVIRENMIDHVFEKPLEGKGEGTTRFGFCSELEAYLNAHQGSSVVFGTVAPPRKWSPHPWASAKDCEFDADAFRQHVPSDAELIVGFTPGPWSYRDPDEQTRRLELLRYWGRCIHAGALLTNLPPTWPDLYFGDKRHLNVEGQKRFTAALAKELAPLLERSEPTPTGRGSESRREGGKRSDSKLTH